VSHLLVGAEQGRRWSEQSRVAVGRSASVGRHCEHAGKLNLIILNQNVSCYIEINF
jgi:hypothetical protein